MNNAISSLHARKSLVGEDDILEMLDVVYSPDREVDSMLRKLVLQKFTWDCSAAKFKELKERLPRRLLEEFGQMWLTERDRRAISGAVAAKEQFFYSNSRPSDSQETTKEVSKSKTPARRML